MVLQLCLQAAHKIIKTWLTFTLEALSGQNGPDIAKCLIDLAVDYDVIVFGPMTHLVGRLRHSPIYGLIIVLGARAQAPLQFRNRWRQHENAYQVAARLVAKLLGALPVDVKQNVATNGK